MRMKTAGLAGAMLLALSVPATAQRAEVTTDLNMRAGPGTRYPVITTIPDGGGVRLHGCVSGYDWCDVSWRGNRGWVFADYLNYRYRNRLRPIPEWGAQVDLPILSFSFGTYADRHYRGMPWYGDRHRWGRHHGRDRDYRDRDWRRGDRHRDWRDRDRNERRGDRNEPRRDRDGDRDQRRGDRNDGTRARTPVDRSSVFGGGTNPDANIRARGDAQTGRGSDNGKDPFKK